MFKNYSSKEKDEWLRAVKKNPIEFFKSFCGKLEEKRKRTRNTSGGSEWDRLYQVMAANFHKDDYTAVFEELAKNGNLNLTSSQKNKRDQRTICL